MSQIYLTISLWEQTKLQQTICTLTYGVWFGNVNKERKFDLKFGVKWRQSCYFSPYIFFFWKFHFIRFSTKIKQITFQNAHFDNVIQGQLLPRTLNYLIFASLDTKTFPVFGYISVEYFQVNTIKISKTKWKSVNIFKFWAKRR